MMGEEVNGRGKGLNGKKDVLNEGKKC